MNNVLRHVYRRLKLQYIHVVSNALEPLNISLSTLSIRWILWCYLPFYFMLVYELRILRLHTHPFWKSSTDTAVQSISVHLDSMLVILRWLLWLMRKYRWVRHVIPSTCTWHYGKSHPCGGCVASIQVIKVSHVINWMTDSYFSDRWFSCWSATA